MAEITRISFHDQIQKNKIKSIVLMGIIIAFFILLGYVISLVFDQSYFFIIMIISIIFSIGYTYYGYYNSDKISLRSVGAYPASPTAHRQYFHSVEGLCLASGLPIPRLFVMPGEQINAFASGRDLKNAVICVTEGSLRKLNKQEMEGVLAHELSHIANYDIRFMTLTAVLVGMVAIAAEIFLRSMWLGGGGGGRNRNGRGQAVLLLLGILLSILAPIAVKIVQLAVSRKREYVADAHAVKLTRYPDGLINALSKIKDDKPMKVNKAVASLFLSDPFKRKVQNLFSTHPPLETRIEVLRRM
ncbi:M48 family metallopeptidase [Candidatus Pacearchaeota archaeon]|nr:M48 family metallopeptidase [Candidatus Pacearchaeota archaeon]